MCALIPIFFAAMMKARRTINAIAVEQCHGRHVNRAQADTKSSGKEDPSRKLKAERA